MENNKMVITLNKLNKSRWNLAQLVIMIGALN